MRVKTKGGASSVKIPYIFNIQKFSVHDGPGIRTTIFFKGCPIRCQWCHNPESQTYEPEYMATKEGQQELVGKQYSIKELVKKVQSDQIFYDQSGGGVTLSGGEVMTQDIDYVEDLVKSLHRLGISVAIDTCGVAPLENYRRLIPYTSLFLYDLKFIDSQMHRKYTDASNKMVLKNLKFISEQQGKINLRLILLEGLNANLAVIERTVAWLKEEQVRIEAINLLPYHDFGRDKYQRLGRECTQNFERPTDEQIAELQTYLEAEGYRTIIGG